MTLDIFTAISNNLRSFSSPQRFLMNPAQSPPHLRPTSVIPEDPVRRGIPVEKVLVNLLKVFSKM